MLDLRHLFGGSTLFGTLVQDADVSIRRRALELVYALVNESNIQALTSELLDYLKVRVLRHLTCEGSAPKLNPYAESA